MQPLGPAQRPGQRPTKAPAPKRRKRGGFQLFKKKTATRAEPPVTSAPQPVAEPEVAKAKPSLWARLFKARTSAQHTDISIKPLDQKIAEAVEKKQQPKRAGLLTRLAERRRKKLIQSGRMDPAPSRARYRWNRLMMRPAARALILKGGPTLAMTAFVALLLSNGDLRRDISETYAQLRSDIVQRPELFVQVMEIKGASPKVDRQIRLSSGLDLPVSSFEMDLADLRARLERLDAVKSASIFLRSGGVLEIQIEERTPVMLWRGASGLEALDLDGVRTAYVDRRSAYPGLPLIVGDGAKDHVGEALRLFRQLQPIAHRVRGLRRVSERRWDVLTDNGPVIMLPQDKPARALAHVLALQNAQDLFEKDITAVDMRLTDRPAIRIGAKPKPVEIFATSATIGASEEN
ncbi:MAG: cell division protein FtsQ/DivIB [Pseudomonadota bacterium]